MSNSSANLPICLQLTLSVLICVRLATSDHILYNYHHLTAGASSTTPILIKAGNEEHLVDRLILHLERAIYAKVI